MAHFQNIIIREVKKTEVTALQEIGKVTFAEAFGTYNVPSDLEKYMAQSFGFERIKSEFDHPESYFYFAESEGEIVGYLKVNKEGAQTESTIENALEIERIYVLSKFHGKNVGQLLYNKALEIAKSENFERIWLGVWEKNPKAIRFYEKNGFVTFDKHIFKLGNDEQTDILMKLEL